jgi:hypothetical protein
MPEIQIELDKEFIIVVQNRLQKIQYSLNYLLCFLGFTLELQHDRFNILVSLALYFLQITSVVILMNNVGPRV